LLGDFTAIFRDVCVILTALQFRIICPDGNLLLSVVRNASIVFRFLQRLRKKFYYCWLAE